MNLVKKSADSLRRCQPPIYPPPRNEQELLWRAAALSGLTLSELATQAAWVIPPNLKKAKGWVGTLLEFHLGADAASKPERDFSQIGIELKTIPINAAGKPLETTFICIAPLTDNSGITWENSHVRYKLSRVLWIPVEGERQIPLSERRIGTPLLWSPSEQEEEKLRNDWEELMDLIVLGEIHRITARLGEVLQLRPKAANGRVLTKAIGENGQSVMARPLGFYLKKNFTSALLARHFSL